MTRQEKVFINNQIERFRKQKDSEIDMFMGRMEAINHEIRQYKKQLKENVK